MFLVLQNSLFRVRCLVFDAKPSQAWTVQMDSEAFVCPERGAMC